MHTTVRELHDNRFVTKNWQVTLHSIKPDSVTRESEKHYVSFVGPQAEALANEYSNFKLAAKPPATATESQRPTVPPGNPVQWVDSVTGGWHTGVVVRLPVCTGSTDILTPKDGYGGVLVRHDHTNELQFVKQSVLQRRPMRDEFEPDLVAPTIGPANVWNAGTVDCTAD